jgi:hypothetical protein
MAFDTSKAGKLVAEQMEALENDFGDDAEIGEICTVVEVRVPQGNDMFESQVRVRYSGHPFFIMGMLDIARKSMTGPDA